MILTGIQAFIICLLASIGLLTVLGLLFIYIILYLNRADRRKNGCDYVSSNKK